MFSEKTNRNNFGKTWRRTGRSGGHGDVEDNDGEKVEYNRRSDANENGYVNQQNINTVEEMIDMMAASGHEANVTAFNAMKGMAMTALNIGK